MNSTTIRIKIETKKKLDEIGKKNETYTDVIERLLEFYKRGGANGKK